MKAKLSLLKPRIHIHIALPLLEVSRALLCFRARAYSLVTVALLLLLSACNTTLAGSATWDSSGSTDWNTNANWSPATGYPGTTASDTATFNNLSSVTSIFVFATPANALDGITFTVSETHAFTITLDAGVDVGISGTGITNSSAQPQNFMLNNTGNTLSEMDFNGTNSTAGSNVNYTDEKMLAT